ncbi:SIR2 family protein [Clostridium estertheticum]|uniref:SIR2 family protein n=1 Tax=Clostridium estertheticum TaxID=238834 RepID=UPI001CF4BCAF|nr:SIR2 family protein [Clostridium estertheticum]MCB2352664.1 SIR2 family protein [Clostridium estertheticum]WAG39975.1 SIR2 family protein [Clostridium estertheticum]
METTLLIKMFIRDYVKEIQESNAAIFAGAGLSRELGFVDWKGLLKEIALDLGLDVYKEDNLIALAQFHVNEYKRTKINQTILKEFTKNAENTPNHDILTRLPIKTYWTTNYDTIIEDVFKKSDKLLDVKTDPNTISDNLPNRDAILYKMHGDVKNVSNAVITKDDYEGYNTHRKLFTNGLIGDLTTKTFLFIGFSFNDPNLSYILSRVNSLLEESIRTHYCFMKELELKDTNGDNNLFIYQTVKQKLVIKDMERYGVKTILIKKYSDITIILKLIESQFRNKNIFISGSAHEYGKYTENDIMEFSSNLSKDLIRIEKNIITGFGLGIGSYIISGALEELYNNKKKIETRLLLRPFPQNIQDPDIRKKTFTKYREDMLSDAGISIFMFGNKISHEDKSIQLADGVMEEFSIATKNGSIPIPIGAFGYISKKLWDIVMNDFSHYVPSPDLKSLYEIIGDNTKTTNELLQAVIKIIEELSKIK